MSTTTATLNVNATQATQALTRVQKQVNDLGSAFSRLGNLVGGLALGSMITNLLRSADAMADLSAATGISIATINGLSSAFLANGADADTAQTAILKFNDSVTEAAQGSDKTIQTFARLGVSLNDIATLSEQDLLRKTIKGLGEMGPGALRTATSMDIFGKAARTVDFTGVNNQLDQFIEKSKEAEPGITRAAELFDNLQAIGKDFGTEFAKEFEPILKGLKELTSNTKQIAESLVQLTKIVLAFGAAWLIFGKILPAINVFTGMIANAGKAGAVFGLMFKNLKRVVIDFVAIFKSVKFKGAAVKDLEVFGQKISNVKGGLLAFINVIANLARVFFRFAGVVGILYAVGQAVDIVVKKLFDFSILDWLGEKFKYVTDKIKQFLSYLGFTFDTAPVDSLTESIDETADATNRAGQNLDDLYEKNKKFLESVKDISKAYREQNSEVLKTLDNQMKSLHMTDQQIAIAKLEEDSIKSLQKTLDDLEKKRKEAIEQRNKGGIDNVDAIDREIASVRRLADATLQSSKVMTDAYHTELNMIEMRKQALDESIAAAQNQLTIQQLEDQISLIGLYGDELQEQTQYLQVIHDLQNTIQGYVAELLRLEQLRKENRIGEAEYQREVNHLQNMITLSAEYANARIEAEKKILEAQKATQENAALGAKQALEGIAEQFKPYNMAQEAIRKGWDKIGNAVDQFVETGKFKFSDFARSVIQDLTKMIAKALIFKAIETAIGAIFPGFKLPGRAEGGPVKGGSPYIVGEKGPELFVPQGSGKIVPNNQLGTSSQGGMTASAGPITNNYNTYNINALDAKSVAQLFAENRKAIFGANKMAEREMSYAGVR